MDDCVPYTFPLAAVAAAGTVGAVSYSIAQWKEKKNKEEMEELLKHILVELKRHNISPKHSWDDDPYQIVISQIRQLSRAFSDQKLQHSVELLGIEDATADLRKDASDAKMAKIKIDGKLSDLRKALTPDGARRPYTADQVCRLFIELTEFRTNMDPLAKGPLTLWALQDLFRTVEEQHSASVTKEFHEEEMGKVQESCNSVALSLQDCEKDVNQLFAFIHSLVLVLESQAISVPGMKRYPPELFSSLQQLSESGTQLRFATKVAKNGRKVLDQMVECIVNALETKNEAFIELDDSIEEWQLTLAEKAKEVDILEEKHKQQEKALEKERAETEKLRNDLQKSSAESTSKGIKVVQENKRSAELSKKLGDLGKSLQDECAAKKKQEELAATAKQELERTKAIYDRQVAALQQQLQVANTISNDQKRKIEEVRIDLAHVTSQRDLAQQAVADQNREFDCLEQQYQHERNGLADDVAELRRKLENCCREREEHETSAKELSQQLKQEQNNFALESSKLRKENTEMIAKGAAKDEDIAIIRQNYENQLAEKDAISDRTQSELKQASLRVRALEKELDTTRKDRYSAQQEVLQVHNDIDGVIDENDKLKEELADVKRKYDESVNELRSEKADLDVSLKSKEKQLIALREANEEKLRKKEAKFSDIENNLANSKVELDYVRSETETLIKELLAVKKERDTANEEVSNLRKMIEESSVFLADLKNLQAQNKTLSKEAEEASSLRKKMKIFESINAEKDKLEAKLDEEKARFEKMVAGLRNDYDVKQEELNVAEENICRVQKDKDAEILCLKNEHDAMKEQVSDLRKMVGDLEDICEENGKLKGELKSAQDQYEYEIKSVRNSRDNMQTRLEDATNQLDKLRRESEVKAANLIQDRNSKHLAIEQAREELAKSQLEVERLESQLESLNSKKKSAEKSLIDFKEQLSLIEKGERLATKQCEDLKASHHVELNNLKSANEELSQRLIQQENEHADKKTEFEQELQQRDEKVQTLQWKVYDLNCELKYVKVLSDTAVDQYEQPSKVMSSEHAAQVCAHNMEGKILDAQNACQLPLSSMNSSQPRVTDYRSGEYSCVEDCGFNFMPNDRDQDIDKHLSRCDAAKQQNLVKAYDLRVYHRQYAIRQGLVECYGCGQFFDKSFIKTHGPKCIEDATTSWCICGWECDFLKTEAEVQEHMRNCPRKDNINTFTCNLCPNDRDKHFPHNAWVRKVHMQKHPNYKQRRNKESRKKYRARKAFKLATPSSTEPTSEEMSASSSSQNPDTPYLAPQAIIPASPLIVSSDMIHQPPPSVTRSFHLQQMAPPTPSPMPSMLYSQSLATMPSTPLTSYGSYVRPGHSLTPEPYAPPPSYEFNERPDF